MIPDGEKRKLLEELEKTGNVYVSCAKIGIHRSIYYRWKNEDKGFKKRANEAERHGRENLCDIAEHALLLKVKDKDMNAIKYALAHNSPRYKQKRTDIFTIKHESIGKIPLLPRHTLEDMLDEDERRLNEESIGEA